MAQAKENQLVVFKSMVATKDFQQKLVKAIGNNTGLNADRLIQQTTTLVYKTPQLATCDAMSILVGMVQAAELGLELAGPLGQAWLVPRWNNKKKISEATFQVGYKGYIALAFRSLMVKRFTPRKVHAQDLFEILYGRDQNIKHVRASGDRGEPVHYYCEIELTNGGYDFADMTKEEVVRHRNRYSPAPADKKDYSAWATNFDAMALKTVAAQLGRRSPLAVELCRGASVDGENEYELELSHKAAQEPESEESRTNLLDHRLSEALEESLTQEAEKEPVPITQN